MSIYAAFDDGRQMQIASNSGWSDAGRWIDGLDVEQYGELVHLWEHGWSDNGPLIAQEIMQALEESPPSSEPTVHVIQELLEFAGSGDSGDVLTIGQGIVSGGDHSDRRQRRCTGRTGRTGRRRTGRR